MQFVAEVDINDVPSFYLTDSCYWMYLSQCYQLYICLYMMVRWSSGWDVELVHVCLIPGHDTTWLGR